MNCKYKSMWVYLLLFFSINETCNVICNPYFEELHFLKNIFKNYILLHIFKNMFLRTTFYYLHILKNIFRNFILHNVRWNMITPHFLFFEKWKVVSGASESCKE